MMRQSGVDELSERDRRMRDLADRWLLAWQGRNHPIRPTDEREFWELTAQLLAALADHPPVIIATGQAGRAIRLAAEAIEGALAGKGPAAWKGESRALSAAQRRWIGWATLYRDLARRKVVPDRRPVTTIRAIFGITPDQWRTWKKVPPVPFDLRNYRAWLDHAGEAAWKGYWYHALTRAAAECGYSGNGVNPFAD